MRCAPHCLRTDSWYMINCMFAYCHRLAVAFAAIFFVIGLAGPAAAARYASIVVEAGTGEILYSRNADHRRYPASLVKMMTLYLIFESLEDGRLTLDAELKVSKRAAGQTPSRLGLKQGSSITVEDAILAVVTKSANDAATVLAEALGETEVQFALRMTERARTLGMLRTRFTNATGLPNRRQRTTARDMATLALALFDDFPDRYHYFAIPAFEYNERTYENHNEMLETYAGTDGIKTGYIRASGFNLVASVQRGDRRVVGVVFGGRTAKSRDAHLRALLDRAFATPQRAVAVHIPGIKPRRGAAPRSTGEAEPQPVAVAPTAAHPAPTASLRNTPPVRAVSEPPGRRETRDPLALALLEQKAPARSRELWGVQLGAFKRQDAAHAEIARASSADPWLVASTDASVSEAETARGTLYRARFVGLSETAARDACRRLINQDIVCIAVQIQGVSRLSP